MRELLSNLLYDLDRLYNDYLEIANELDFLTPQSRREYILMVLEELDKSVRGEELL